jgi:uncharacterized protein YecT (DUF1311 family)/tRNA A-37 threonylcarbamoyl transferase component Bud32
MPTEADFPPDLRALESDYELIRELGQGGMAGVYLARERQTGRLVAIKAVRARYVDDPDALQRFAREAQTVAGLDHPNIVRTESIEQVGDRTIAIIMEHVSGGTVRDRLREHGALGAELAESVLRDIASALAYAHQRGIVHRDVKPENVFLDLERGRALLSDFGIARRIDGDGAITLLGAALGTPQYMSPEQIDGAHVDGRSDIYSLGVLGWELLTGRRPWAGESLYGVIYKQKHEDLPRITSLRPRVPANLLFAIEGALVKDREKRWQRAEQFIDCLVYNPPPVLAQDYPSGASRADNEATVLFKRAIMAPPLEIDTPEPVASARSPAAADESVEADVPARDAERERVGELVPAVATAAFADAAEGHQPFAGTDFRLPAFGPNADVAFEPRARRTNVVRGLALLAPLAIAGVSLYVVLGGDGRASEASVGGRLTASDGSVVMENARTPQPVDASHGMRAVVLDTAAPPPPAFADTMPTPVPKTAGPVRGRARPRGPSPAGTAQAQQAQNSKGRRSVVSAESSRAGLTSDSARRTDSVAAAGPPLEDPFRIPTSAAAPVSGAKAPPAAGVPSPRCRLASTADQRACLDAFVSAGDASMQQAFESLVAEMRRVAGTPDGAPDPTNVTRARVEQRAWVSVRNQECRRVPSVDDGAFWASIHARCYNDMAAGRAAELQEAVRRLRRR